MSKRSSRKNGSQPPSRLSLGERGIAYGLACSVVITLITLVLNPRVMTDGTLAIVRFLAALASGLSAYLFLGEAQIQGTIRKTVVRASGGFALFIIVLLLFFYGVPSSEKSEEKSGIDVTLNALNNKIPYESANEIESNCPSKVFPILYDSHYNNPSIIEIKPKLEYLSLVAQNPSGVDLSNFCNFRFENKFPELSVKVVNNTSRTLFLTEAVIQVKVEEKDDKPLLRLYSNYYSPNEFEIINDGWGKVIDPVINLSLAEIETCRKNDRGNAIKNEVFKPGSFEDKTTIKINNILDQLQQKSALCATVDINYFDSKYLKYSSKHKTILWLKEADSPNIQPTPAPPTYRYNLFLDPNFTSSTISLPLSQSISPGDIDNFIVEVSSNRTAKFFMSFLFKSADGVKLNSKSIVLDIFLPRTEANSCDEDETASLLAKEIRQSLAYGQRSKENEYSEFSLGDNYTVYTNIHKHIYDRLRKEIKELNINQIEEYIRNFVHSRQINLCSEAVY